MSGSPAAGAWAPERTADGSWTLRHPVHGQACHSLGGAWTEALERYARPCRVAQLARERGAGAPVRVLDVGTGLGLNLAAALAEAVGAGGRLEALTLELEPGVLDAALALGAAPGAAGPWHAAVLDALARARRGAGRAELAPGCELRLLLGDGRATLPAEPLAAPFDAAFLDPFSPRVDPALWQADFLAEVGRRLTPGGLLSTYSSAFSVRLALRRAGLAVGAGPRVGAKASGTLASRAAALPPLDGRTCRRLERRAHFAGA